MDKTVTTAFQALLNDLQNTTAVLKKASLADKQQQQQDSHYHEAIYEPQQVRMTTKTLTTTTSVQQASHRGLNDLDQMMDDFDGSRSRRPGGRPTVESLFETLDGAVPNGNSSAQAQHRPVSASSASKDLDDLMASLHDFKLKSQTAAAKDSTDGAYAKPTKSPREQPNQLDSMLGSLQQDMTKIGINTIPKGDCAACQKAIIGQVVIALGKMWHPEHFMCAHCGEELGHKNFFERSNKAYCEADYHNLFSPRCAYCNGPIKDKCVTALEKTWHTEHFFCAQCGKDFGEEGFHEKDGRAYCKLDYFNMFAPRCRGCDRPISHNYITALNTQWHPECFVCADCRQPFAGGSFFDHEGQPYCETHYHEKRGSLCAGCGKPISGRCVTAMAKKFHPEHFVCSFCLKQLNKGTFKEHENKPYCHECFTKLLS